MLLLYTAAVKNKLLYVILVLVNFIPRNFNFYCVHHYYLEGNIINQIKY